jgi:phosphatidylinositol glycan class V
MPAPNPSAAAAALRNPTQTLIAAFAAWKVFLLAVAVGSCFVGAAYDTSASLLAPPLDGRGLVGLGNTSTPTAATSISTTTTTLVTRLTSWDAIYFTQTARRGYLFEQEWAFGTGLPLVIFYLGKGGTLSRPPSFPICWALPSFFVSRLPETYFVPRLPVKT